MLLKTFFFNIYLLSLNLTSYLAGFLILAIYLFLHTTLRNKFFLFLVITCLLSIWGFLYNLDGMILILLTAELTIFLLFLMTYIQLYTNYSFLSNSNSNYIHLVLPIILIILTITTQETTEYINFYSGIYSIVSGDFFILYFLLFDKLSILTVILTIIIGLFSLFFIILYFNLKIIKLKKTAKQKQLYFLRKQNLTKQTTFKNKIYTFQN